MIKAIVFDMHGVVLNRGTFGPLAKEYARMLGLKKKDVHDALDRHWEPWKVGGISEREFFQKLAEDTGFRGDREKLKAMMYDPVKPYKSVLRLARRLEKRYRIYSLTNHAREFFEFLNGKFGLEGSFEAVFKSYDARLAKPDPEFYRHMLRKIGMKPEECVLIDDFEENVAAARKLGMKGIVHVNAKRTERELRGFGVKL